MDIVTLKNIMQSSGVAGAGGAGFPSYAKLSDKADIIILNCAECEPLLKLHRQLLEHHAKEIVSALATVAEACGAKEFVVGVKGSYKGAVAAVTAELANYPNGRLKILREVYPAGDEVVLIYQVTGHVVPAGGLPIEVGAIVYNVETMLNTYYAITKNRPVTHKYVTVAGCVAQPKTLCAPIGTPFSELIALCGGKTVPETAIIHGGPMTGRLADESMCVTKTSNAILVLPRDHYLIGKRTQKTTISAKRAMSVCCQCHTCTDLCPRNLLGHPIDPAAFMRSVSSTVAETRALLNTQYCSQCGLCEMYACPQGLSPATLIGIYKSNLKKNGVPFEKQPQSDEHVHPDRYYRRIPMARLLQRLGLADYNVRAPLSDESVSPRTLFISLSQNIGAPSVPVVKAGDAVSAGDRIAENAEGALSLPLHAPLSGVISDVTDKQIVLKLKG